MEEFREGLVHNIKETKSVLKPKPLGGVKTDEILASLSAKVTWVVPRFTECLARVHTDNSELFSASKPFNCLR